jgi:hypothetical protein
MGTLEKTHSWQRHAFGSPWDKNICKFTFGYTHTYHEVALGTATSVLAATTCGTTTTTIVDNITQPDVPRVLKITMATAAGIGDGTAIITGTNVEGATITSVFDIVDGTAGATNGTKAFKTVESIVVSPMKGACTIAVGTLDVLGMNHRLFPSNTTIREVIDTSVGDVTTRSLVATAPTITDADEQYIEKNLVTPATTPNGTYTYTFYYDYDAWSVEDVNDDPKYHTSTSTSSTSSSTSTTATPSTSTSSTSVSTSSTSSSTSSTSSSTSSTSTSTTTVP